MSSFLNGLAIVAAAFSLAACQTVELPKATARGYRSARLVQPAPKELPAFPAQSNRPENFIKAALASEFRSNGLRVDPANADLTVAYMVVVQDNASTRVVDDYFGYGRSSMQLADAAHNRGVIHNNRADYYQAGTIIIDVLDNKTGRLIYRDFATRDITGTLSDEQLRARVNSAVKQALAIFFR